MSINFEFHKLKKITQDNLYNSIENNLGITEISSLSTIF